MWLCGGIAAKTARVLLLMVIPGQIIFMLAIKYLQSHKSVNVDVVFAAAYLTAAFIQVTLPGLPGARSEISGPNF